MSEMQIGPLIGLVGAIDRMLGLIIPCRWSVFWIARRSLTLLDRPSERSQRPVTDVMLDSLGVLLGGLAVQAEA